LRERLGAGIRDYLEGRPPRQDFRHTPWAAMRNPPFCDDRRGSAALAAAPGIDFLDQFRLDPDVDICGFSFHVVRCLGAVHQLAKSCDQSVGGGMCRSSAASVDVRLNAPVARPGACAVACKTLLPGRRIV